MACPILAEANPMPVSQRLIFITLPKHNFYYYFNIRDHMLLLSFQKDFTIGLTFVGIFLVRSKAVNGSIFARKINY